MHQIAALVGSEGRLLAGLCPQHVFQKIGKGAGIIPLHPAGGEPQLPAQQLLHGGSVVHRKGLGPRRLLHRVQQLALLGLVPVFRKALEKGRGLAAFRVPALAQQVQRHGRGGSQVRPLQRRFLWRKALDHRRKGTGHRHGGAARRPAEPQAFRRGGEGLVKAHLLPDGPVLEAVRHFHALTHQAFPLGVSEQTLIAGGLGELALGQPQHKAPVRVIQPHPARSGKDHLVQRLGNVAQVGTAHQQLEQVRQLGGGQHLVPQQQGHLVQKVRRQVPHPHRLAGGGDALAGFQLGAH